MLSCVPNNYKSCSTGCFLAAVDRKKGHLWADSQLDLLFMKLLVLMFRCCWESSGVGVEIEVVIVVGVVEVVVFVVEDVVIVRGDVHSSFGLSCVR
jgi:hypothetical protein